LLEQVVVWFGVESGVMSGERKESCCDKKQSLFSVRREERGWGRESCCENKWYWICEVFHI
jgi:hypothetical protein